MTTYTRPTKNAAVYSKPSISTSNSFLLLQNGDNVLLQNGDKIIIGVTVVGAVYTRPTKNIPTYTRPSKN